MASSSLKPPATPYSPSDATAAVTLAMPLPHQTLAGEALLEIQYTPGRDVLAPQDMLSWGQSLSTHKATTWENLGTDLIEAFYDTLLPYKVNISITIQHAGGLRQFVQLQRQRPGT